jgi:hypothetical protein
VSEAEICYAIGYTLRSVCGAMIGANDNVTMPKKIRSFGSSSEKREQQSREARLLELLEADFATLLNEWRIDHPQKVTIWNRVLEEMSELRETLVEGQN